MDGPEEVGGLPQLLQALGSVRGAALGIESIPDVCGGDPCIVRTRIPVWVLVQARRLGASDADLVLAYRQLRAGDLANAWVYAALYRDQIERQIEENEAA